MAFKHRGIGGMPDYPLDVFRGRGQVGWRAAWRISLGRQLTGRQAFYHSVLWGLGTGIANSSMAPYPHSMAVFVSCMLLAFCIGYFSPFLWRVKLHGKQEVPLARVLVTNGLLGLVAGYVVAVICMSLPWMAIYGWEAFFRYAFREIVVAGLWGFIFPLIGFGIVTSEDAARRQRRIAAQARRMERLAEEARLAVLRAQINPHFFFNALNTVAALIPTRPDDAERAVELLAEALRPVLTRDQPLMLPLAEELRVAQAYGEIEGLRYGSRLQIAYDVDEEAGGVMVPSLSIQPLVENAVRHGAGVGAEPHRIVVRTQLVRDGVQPVVRVVVANAPQSRFVELDPLRLQPAGLMKGHALHNISTRLRMLFGEEASLDARVSEAGEGVVMMTVPVETEREGLSRSAGNGGDDRRSPS